MPRITPTPAARPMLLPLLLAVAVFGLVRVGGAWADSPPAADAAAATESVDVGQADEAAAAADERVSLDEIRRFVAVFRAVKQAYVDPIDDARLMQSAIRGLLTDLDPHSAYLDASQSEALNEMASGAYSGLGLEVVQQPDRSLLVVSPIDDTPAARAGIRPGDVIVEIDGRPIGADNLEGAIEAMRGEPGSMVELTIIRDTLREPLKLTLVREQIRVASVRVRRLEPAFAYLRISHFQGDTGLEVRRKLAEMITHGPKLQGLVLDLRRNPGGVLSAAVETADVFLDAGTVVSTRGRLPFSISEFSAHRGDLLEGAPIIALIDSGTASAGEVLATALRDRRRALIMGSTSFGKGSVQTVLPLDNGDALKLTTARYYGPSGRSIQASGIEPDVAVPEDAVLQIGATRPPTVREHNLPRHLHSEFELELAEPLAEASDNDEDDYLVNEALALLKGLALFDRRGGERAADEE
jgi:carboxyl-terminal processing protease